MSGDGDGDGGTGGRGTGGRRGHGAAPPQPPHRGPVPLPVPVPQEQQQREHEEATRDRSRRSESIEKAAVSAGGAGGTRGPGAAADGRPLPVLQEAAVLVSQRPQNPRDFFRQRERAGSASGAPLPAGPLGARPGRCGGREGAGRGGRAGPGAGC